jgi:hypothetical protein
MAPIPVTATRFSLNVFSQTRYKIPGRNSSYSIKVVCFFHDHQAQAEVGIGIGVGACAADETTPKNADTFHG